MNAGICVRLPNLMFVGGNFVIFLNADKDNCASS